MQSASTTFDLAAANYDQQLQQGLSLSGESADFFVSGRVKLMAELLQGLGMQPEKMLDFGCGVGNAARAFQDYLPVRHVAGLDCSAESIDVARRRHRDSCFRWLVDGSALEPASFDLVHTSGVFHHIDPAERNELMQQIWRWLKPGGVFAFFENNPWNPGTRWVMSRIPFDRDAICLSINESRSRLRQAGFELLGHRTLFFFPRSLRFLRRLEHLLQHTPFGAQYLVLCRRPME